MLHLISMTAKAYCGSCMTRFLVVVCCLGFLMSIAAADVVSMKDGRKLEGEIVNRNDKTIELDTAMLNCRATLQLKVEDILSIEEKPLSPDFFNTNRATAKDPASRPARGGTMYLEVPIEGKFGSDVVADGVGQALIYANGTGTRHVVFVIDSTGHFSVGDALEIYGLMMKYRGKITYHAVIKNSLGDGTVIAGLCNTIHMMPDSTIGGSTETGSPSAVLSPEDVAVLRAEIANLLAETVVGRPGKEKVLRAMIDPAQPMAAWKDSAGKLGYAASAPADVKLIFASKLGEPLVLTADQIQSMGNPIFSGKVEDLGKLLGISDWRSSGDYGKTVMKTASESKQKRLAGLQGKFEERVRGNVAMRESLEKSMEHYIREAAKLDPTDNSYDTLLARWDSGLGVSSVSEQSDADPATVQSGIWKKRADGALQNLSMAAKTTVTMERLEKEAVQLGIMTEYKPGELAKIIASLASNVNTIREQKTKK